MQNLTESKILIVEDEPVVMMVHNMMLQSLGYHPDQAENGQKALDLSIKNYDVIFMDIGLPDTTGIDVAREIRRNENSYKKAYIVAVTGYAIEEIEKQCIEAGINAIVNKPVTAEKLQKYIVDSQKMTA